MTHPQGYTLDLLQSLFPEPGVVASLLPNHPVAQEFSVAERTLLAKFPTATFLIDPEGGLTPLVG